MMFPFNKTYKPLSMLNTLPHAADGVTLIYSDRLTSLSTSSSSSPSYERYEWHDDDCHVKGRGKSDSDTEVTRDELIAMTKG
jgi:hypothetical protein